MVSFVDSPMIMLTGYACRVRVQAGLRARQGSDAAVASSCEALHAACHKATL
jgi:hypothetical protein